MKPCSFLDLENTDLIEVDFSGSGIISFDGIERFKKIQKIDLRNSMISTFKNSMEVSTLENIDFRGCPVEKYPFSREMCLFAFGFSIKVINGEPVKQSEYNLQNHQKKAEIEKIVRAGEIIVLNNNENYVKCHTYTSLDNSLYSIKSSPKKEESKHFSVNQLIQNISETTNMLHDLRIKNGLNNDCFMFQIPMKYTEDSIPELIQKLNSLKSPSEYKKDQIRLEAQRTKANEAITQLQNSLNNLNAKLQGSENSLAAANETNSRIHQEILKLTYYDEVVKSVLEDLNALKNERTIIGRMEIDIEYYTQHIKKYKQNLKSRSKLIKTVDQRSIELKRKIETQQQQINDLKANEIKIKAKKEELLKLIAAKKEEKDRIEKEKQMVLDQLTKEKTKQAAEFIQISASIQKDIEESEPSIEELAKMPL